MKKLFLIISIFILTVTLSAYDFEIPDFSNSYEEAFEELKELPIDLKKYKEESWIIKGLNLKWRGKSARQIYFNKVNENCYFYNVFLNNMSTNDWVDFILTLLNDCEIRNYRDEQGLIFAVYKANSYDVEFHFEEFESVENGLTKLVTIAKMPN